MLRVAGSLASQTQGPSTTADGRESQKAVRKTDDITCNGNKETLT